MALYGCWWGSWAAARRASGRSDLARPAEGKLDAMPGGLVLTHNAGGIYAQEHVDAVAGPLGDLGRGNAGVEPQRDRSVA